MGRIALIAVLAALGLAGCASESAPASAEQTQSFEGSAPPPGAMEKAQAEAAKAREAAQQKVAQQRAGTNTP